MWKRTNAVALNRVKLYIERSSTSKGNTFAYAGLVLYKHHPTKSQPTLDLENDIAIEGNDANAVVAVWYFAGVLLQLKREWTSTTVRNLQLQSLTLFNRLLSQIWIEMRRRCKEQNHTQLNFI